MAFSWKGCRGLCERPAAFCRHHRTPAGPPINRVALRYITGSPSPRRNTGRPLSQPGNSFQHTGRYIEAIIPGQYSLINRFRGMSPKKHALSGSRAKARLEFSEPRRSCSPYSPARLGRQLQRRKQSRARSASIRLATAPAPAIKRKSAESSCRTRRRSGSKLTAFRRESTTRYAIRNPIRLPQHRLISSTFM